MTKNQIARKMVQLIADAQADVRRWFVVDHHKQQDAQKRLDQLKKDFDKFMKSA
jgi:hypothetical protein